MGFYACSVTIATHNNKTRMHSSRMHTARSLPYRGDSVQEGWSLSRGSLSGGSLSGRPPPTVNRITFSQLRLRVVTRHFNWVSTALLPPVQDYIVESGRRRVPVHWDLSWTSLNMSRPKTKALYRGEGAMYCTGIISGQTDRTENTTFATPLVGGKKLSTLKKPTQPDSRKSRKKHSRLLLFYKQSNI